MLQWYICPLANTYLIELNIPWSSPNIVTMLKFSNSVKRHKHFQEVLIEAIGGEGATDPLVSRRLLSQRGKLEGLANFVVPLANNRSTGRHLRIGYASSSLVLIEADPHSFLRI